MRGGGSGVEGGREEGERKEKGQGGKKSGREKWAATKLQLPKTFTSKTTSIFVRVSFTFWPQPNYPERGGLIIINP